jgi:hypothetical protein
MKANLLVALAGFGGSIRLDFIRRVPRVRRHRDVPQALARIRVAVESALSGGKG